MKIEIADLITRSDGKYITLDVINYEGKEYAFVNKLTEEDEDPTEELYVFTPTSEGTTKITDEELLNKLLPIFQENLEKEIKKIMESETN